MTKFQWLRQQCVSAAHSCPAVLHVAVDRHSFLQETGKKWLLLLFCIWEVLGSSYWPGEQLFCLRFLCFLSSVVPSTDYNCFI